MIKKASTPQYNKGDYITGIDRSYPRTIYVYRGMNKESTEVSFEVISFRKRSYLSFAREKRTMSLPAELAETYRLATREELITEGIIPLNYEGF